MYLYNRKVRESASIPSGSRESGFGGLAATVVAPHPRTGEPCRADERRIRPITEPAPHELVNIAPRYLADPSRPKQLHRAAYEAYLRMKVAAEADGIPANLLTITSGYRSVAHQQRLWAEALRKYGSPQAARRWVAPPGGSPHHTGRAIDLWLGTRNSSDNIAALRATLPYKWLVCNASRFGFFPYAHEPWHWEFNPEGFVAPSTRPATARTPTPSRVPRPSVPSTQAVPRAAAPGARALRENLRRLALQEGQRWGQGQLKEHDPRMRPVLQDYWLTGVKWIPSTPRWWSQVPWSAAFISWLMRKAGAGNAFKYSSAHATYIKAAKDNRLANNENPFKAYRINELRPEVGDLVCKSRAGSGANYENIRRGLATHCDVVVEVQPGRLSTIGGNVDNSVSSTPVRTDANGYINQPGYFAVIKVGEPSR